MGDNVIVVQEEEVGVLLREAPETSVCAPAFSNAEFCFTYCRCPVGLTQNPSTLQHQLFLHVRI